MKKAKKSNYYFDSFPILAGYSVKCGEMILDYLKNFDPKRLEEVKTSVHEIEHKADEVKHEVTAKLLTEFMTPIDREDIFQLLKMIDDVTDAVEEISLKLYLYNYTELPFDTVEYMELTVNCVRKMVECLGQFHHYLNKEIFEPYVMEVVKLEEQSDAKYIADMHRLYMTETDGFKRHKSEAMYVMLEEVADRCREVCRYVQNIALKNI